VCATNSETAHTILPSRREVCVTNSETAHTILPSRREVSATNLGLARTIPLSRPEVFVMSLETVSNASTTSRLADLADDLGPYDPAVEARGVCDEFGNCPYDPTVEARGVCDEFDSLLRARQNRLTS
jgi:hypothetical protein